MMCNNIRNHEEEEQRKKKNMETQENLIEEFSTKWIEVSSQINDLNATKIRNTDMIKTIDSTIEEYNNKLINLKNELENLDDLEENDLTLKVADIRNKIKIKENHIESLKKDKNNKEHDLNEKLKNQSEISINLLERVNQQKIKVIGKSFKPVSVVFMVNNSQCMALDYHTNEPIKEGIKTYINNRTKEFANVILDKSLQ